MSTVDLLGRLEEAKGPKISWKNKSAAEWELYTYSTDKGPDVSDKKKEAKAAASALNKAMKVIAKEISKLVVEHSYDEAWWSKKLGALHTKYIRPVEKKYGDTGITDTEPNYHVGQGMIDMVKNWYGIKGWTNLGDWL